MDLNSVAGRFCSGLSKSRELLLQYKGGGVVCHKDSATGIAVVTLNHVQRKNALSGKQDCCSKLLITKNKFIPIISFDSSLFLEVLI